MRYHTNTDRNGRRTDRSNHETGATDNPPSPSEINPYRKVLPQLTSRLGTPSHGLGDAAETTVSLDRESHQVLVSLDAPGVRIAVAFDPWVDDLAIPIALAELEKELQHAHEVGPNRAAELDLIADGGDDDRDGEEWNPEPCSLREGETTDVSGHARRNIEQLRRAEQELDRDLSDRIEELQEERDDE